MSIAHILHTIALLVLINGICNVIAFRMRYGSFDLATATRGME